MRKLLILWVAPISFLIGWYLLASNDVSFGMWFFSREMHDLTFALYGETLGIDPESIPPLVARALVIDTALVLAIFAFRRRKTIANWWRERSVRRGGHAVERPLKNEGGGGRIDAGGALGARDVGLDQPALGRDGRQALVPEGQRPVVQA
jgi:hypothetical protein